MTDDVRQPLRALERERERIRALLAEREALMQEPAMRSNADGNLALRRAGISALAKSLEASSRAIKSAERKLPASLRRKATR